MYVYIYNTYIYIYIYIYICIYIYILGKFQKSKSLFWDPFLRKYRRKNNFQQNLGSAST